MPQTHFALSVEPAGPAAPGSIRHVRYRAFNASAILAPPATVAIVLPPGTTALGETSIAIPPLGPGEATIVDLPVRLDHPLADGTRLVFQAALCVDGAQALGSNAVSVDVVSRARFDRTSRIAIEHGEAHGELWVTADLTNAGDDTADGWTFELLPPLGTVATEPLARFALDGLMPGETRTFRLRTGIIDPPGSALVAADACVRAPDGTLTALAPSPPFALAAEAAAPAIACTVDGRRIDVRIVAANAGYASLDGATLQVSWPVELRCADASVECEGAPIAARSKATSLSLPLPPIAHGSSVTIGCSLFARSAVRGGEITATLTSRGIARSASAPFVRTPRAQISVRAIERPATPVDAGEIASVKFEVANAGETARELMCASSEATLTPTRVTLAPGARKQVHATMRVPAGIGDGTIVPLAFTARDENGTVATCTASIVARDRVWLDTTAWLDASEEPRIVLTHRGATPATGVRIVLENGATLDAGDIAPGTACSIPLGAVPLAQAARGGYATDGRQRWPLAALAPGGAGGEATFAFETPPDIARGRATNIVLRAHVLRAAAHLSVRIVRDESLLMLPGSTRVNGFALADRHDGPALQSADGLALHGIEAGTEIVIAWSAIAAGDRDPIVLHAHTLVDGLPLEIVSPPIIRAERAAFAAETADLPFHIDGIAIARPVPAVEPQADEPQAIEPVAWMPSFDESFSPDTLHLDAARSRLIGRLLGTPGSTAALAHAFALRALAPDPPAGDADALHAWRDATATAHDRLYVKLRIPGYRAIPAEFEDAAMRRAYEALPGSVDLSGVPLGDGRALAAHAALLATTSSDAELDGVLVTYVEALRSAFAAGIDLEAPDRLLDDARAALVAASMAVAA